MRLKRNWITAGVTFSLVLASGYLLRNSDQLSAQFGDKATSQASLSAFVPTTQNPAGPGRVNTSSMNAAIILPQPPAAALVPVYFELDATALADRLARTGSRTKAGRLKDIERSSFGLACDITVTARVMPAAQVSLNIAAPCHGEEAVVIRQGELAVTESLSVVGSASILIPVLSDVAVFELLFADGTSVTTSAYVPEAVNYDRVALQWVGESGLEIHALEFGAAYGDAGHVWRLAPRSAATAARGGFLTSLGSSELAEGYRAVIYSFPTGSSQRTGVVRLNVEAEVTAANCGHEISAQSFQKTGDGKVQMTDLTLLSVPGCDAIGDILLLKNLLQDLKIAQN